MSQPTAAVTRRSTTTVVTAIAACAAAVTGIVIVVLVSFGGTTTAHAAAASHPAPPAAATTSGHATSASTRGAGGDTPAPTPARHVVVLPAAQVTTIQQELASLNYYEGPIDGAMNPQTVQAITYLQRDAQLPQTGDWNQVTYLAMQHLLANGNNQMAG